MKSRIDEMRFCSLLMLSLIWLSRGRASWHTPTVAEDNTPLLTRTPIVAAYDTPLLTVYS